MEVNVKAISKSKVWGMDLLMILVSLGTQDRQFTRLLDAIEKQIELGNIKDRVVVQAGETKYSSKHMEIFDLIPSDEFLKLLQECDLLICHGGVGTIIDGLKYHKKIIAAARLKEYSEHQNNHQKQIIAEFTKEGMILELDDFDKLDEKLLEAKNFKPKEYKSNTENFISILEEYIENSTSNNKGNLFRRFMIYAFYGVIGFLFEALLLWTFTSLHFSILISVCYFSLFFVLYRFFMHRLFFRNVKLDPKGEAIFLFSLALQIISVFIFPTFFEVHFLFKMFVFSVLIFVLVFVFNTIFKIQDVDNF